MSAVRDVKRGSTNEPSPTDGATARQNGVHRIQVFLASDHGLLRTGLRDILSGEPDLHHCGEATSLANHQEVLQDLRPRVFMVDISLGQAAGLKQVRELCQSCGRDTAVLVLASHVEAFVAGLALEAGVRGFISARESPAEIVRAIRQVAQGQVYLSPTLTSELLGYATNGHKVSPMQSLTQREFQVFELIGQGHTTKAIGRSLTLSPHTIETYRERLRQKLGVGNGAELTFRAIVWGIMQGS